MTQVSFQVTFLTVNNAGSGKGSKGGKSEGGANTNNKRGSGPAGKRGGANRNTNKRKAADAKNRSSNLTSELLDMLLSESEADSEDQEEDSSDENLTRACNQLYSPYSENAFLAG